MKSHSYDFLWPDLLRLLGPPLVPVVLFAAVVHFGTWANLLPSPRPTYDVDHTILFHQAEAAQQKNPTDIIFIGDSSCLMDVSAPKLSELLGCTALNLGTLSYLDLSSYGLLLKHYATSNPGSPRMVVLLMHPEALRYSSSESYYTNFLHQLLAGSAPPQLGTSLKRWNAILALDKFKASVLTRLLPFPLPGAYARQYGFNWDLELHLTLHRGSLADPEPRSFQGNAEYSLARRLEPASRVFKSSVPDHARLFVGITPVPETFAKAGYAALHAKMLKQWSQWLNAIPLELPATMPPQHFAKTTHLNAAGVEAYTFLLSQTLKRQMN